MKKIKSFIDSNKGKDLLTILIVILVGLGSFQLGKLSQKNTIESPKIDFTSTQITQTSKDASKSADIKVLGLTPETAQKTGSGEYFGSNKGSKYYPINCIAGKTIKEENRIYFSSAEEAENAGYQPSDSC
jgi:hypothetical protein